ncbi:DNA adenine methyltransferase YhdJ (plasmid) [Paracoccus marcusii]|uniref:site-specific DNA-methyltransferase n=1 Tax=Paracoccus marcusii TaxID=59779 RepID=UPI001C3C9C53|nr:site-specific DNA-methyltransferase [Paracoccus marcusii]QXI65950.1 DNA adenine methyltransferase YhdJ [Paracoccus marcusii]
MAAKTKLELTWIGKDNRPRLEPRILIEEPEFSHHASTRREGDIFDNMLIHGDNLLALKALETDPAVRGKVKCIYIDPPYNTGNAFERYEDGLEHSLWLSLMRERIISLRNLLSEDGFFCCQIDDNESSYLKVMLDEIFGRGNYLTTFYMQVRYGNKSLAEDSDYQKVIEQCHIYAKNSLFGKAVKEKQEYKVEKFEWEIDELEQGYAFEAGGKRVELFKQSQYKIRKVESHLQALKETWATGSLVRQKGSSGEFLDKILIPRKSEDGLSCLYKVYGIGEDGLGYRYMTGPKKDTATKGKFYSGIPLKTLADLKSGHSLKEKPIENFYDLAGSFGNCRHEGGVDFGAGKKPERLIEIILQHFSRPGDLVLDSFAGSGTTGAVAHKMGRRWIMVELGEHARTHIVPRMKKVIDGTDKGGVTEAAGWKGGGGYRFFRLAPSLLQKDTWGNWVISKDYNAEMLAEAMCKHFNYVYAPSTEAYWMHGQGSENAFIYVTTASLTIEQLRAISDEVGEDRSLLICCMAYEAQGESLSNLTLKKIPRVVLDRCEWGQDDYSLKINALPMAEDEPDDIDDTPAPKKSAKAKAADTPDLFGAE